MTRIALKHRSRDAYPGTYTRREMVCILGSFLIFLTSIPGRSESPINSAITVGRHLIQLVLIFLGLVTPTVQTPVAPLAHPKALVHHLKAPVPVVKPIPNSMLLGSDPLLHRYNYIFEGKATFHNIPCPNASVLVRMTSGDNTVAEGTVTDANGSYHLKIAIDAEDRAPVDWTMEAYTADFKSVELSGRQIVQREDVEVQKPTVVTTPLDFRVSSSKVSN